VNREARICWCERGNSKAPAIKSRFWYDWCEASAAGRDDAMFHRQGQAHIVSTAIRSPGPASGPAEVGGAPWFPTLFSIDPQPANISARVNINIVFIVVVFDCGRIILHPPSKTILARSCELGRDLLPLARAASKNSPVP
jgi:hypothetical protein